MNEKKWYLSKSVWAGVVAVIVAGYNAAATSFGIPAIPEFVFAVLGAFGVYSRSVADSKLVK